MPHGVMVMDTAARTSRKAGSDRSEGRGQTQWKTKVVGGRLSTGGVRRKGGGFELHKV